MSGKTGSFIVREEVKLNNCSIYMLEILHEKIVQQVMYMFPLFKIAASAMPLIQPGQIWYQNVSWSLIGRYCSFLFCAAI